VYGPFARLSVIFDLPSIRTAHDLVAALGMIARAVATGMLTPEEAQAVGAVLDAM
jgi:hypothetical protein